MLIKWDDLSDEAEQQSLERTKNNLKWVKSNIDVSKLDKATRLSYDLFCCIIGTRNRRFQIPFP